MEQADQVVPQGDLLHDLHYQLILIHGNVGGGVDRSQLVLGRSHLVVLRLCQDAQLPELPVQVLHIGRDTGLDGPEVVIVHLLSLGRHGSEERPAGEEQILALQIQIPIDQEVFLLRAHAGPDPADFPVSEKPKDPQRLAVERVHGAQQGGLLIQGLAAVGAEGRGDAKGLSLYEGVGSGVPGSIAPGLKGSPQTAGGEGRGVRFAPDQLLAGELRNDAAVGGRADKALMLFRCDPGERLKPVGKMGGPMFQRPGLHRAGYGVCRVKLQIRAFLYGLAQLSIDLCRKRRFHDAVVKYQTAKAFKIVFHSVSSPENEFDP